MTPEVCKDFCAGEGVFTAYGVEFGKECYCGAVPPASAKIDEAACDLPCGGDNTQTCGGADAINVFEVSSSSTSLWRKLANFMYIGPQQRKNPAGGGPGCQTYPLDPKCQTQPTGESVPADGPTVLGAASDTFDCNNSCFCDWSTGQEPRYSYFCNQARRLTSLIAQGFNR